MADERPSPFFLGLDLGLAADFSALVCVQQSPLADRPNLALWHYELRAAYRWALRTPYSVIAAETKQKVSKEPLPGSVLAVDCTGVGQPVAELLRDAEPPVTIHNVVITGGNSYNRDGNNWHVSKVQLIANVVALLDSDRLDLPRAIPNADVLAEELKLYRMKVTASGNETFDSPSARHHDDLTLALACWMGEQVCAWEPPEVLKMPRQSLQGRYSERAAGDRDRLADRASGRRRAIFGHGK